MSQKLTRCFICGEVITPSEPRIYGKTQPKRNSDGVYVSFVVAAHKACFEVQEEALPFICDEAEARAKVLDRWNKSLAKHKVFEAEGIIGRNSDGTPIFRPEREYLEGEES